ncbi:lysozyme [Erythrobacter sp. QSSC1-22B]|uniref:lysozyme n=1 Tax=Erythrobacter sp. QSSC1-22B TaxID=1860125 RepID=UPI001F3A5B60|nr:lysozyme [Erythrobacter sp. QSSC1-22B]
MLQDLDTPLDGTSDRDTSGRDNVASTSTGKPRETADLRRARRAARKVFRVNPSRSARQRATAMLTAGAVGLAAFTGPSSVRFGSDNSENSLVMGSDDPTQNRIHASRISTSAQFKTALIQEEGVRQVVYRDVAGYPTVGVGHLIEPQDNLRVGDRVTKAQVLRFLDGDIAEAEGHVRDLIGDLPLFQHEFDALVDLVYNVGRGNVSASQSPRLNAAIDAGDYERIASELDYTHAAGRVARGLEFRSERRASIFLDAAYEDPREAGSSRSDV